MAESIPLPMSYGIFHPKWRPGQYEAIREIVDCKERFVTAQAVTGSGKSSIGISLSREFDDGIRIITKSRSLQDQYASNSYRGKVLYGLSAYPCALIPGFTATECVFPNDMRACPRSGSCGYLRAKEVMLDSDRQVISYAYWFTAGWLKQEKYWRSLYFDEAHEIPSLTMNYLEKRFDKKWASKVKVRMPKFVSEIQVALQITVKKWLEKVMATMTEEVQYLVDRAAVSGDTDMIKRMIFLRGEVDILGTILYQIASKPDEMMIVLHEHDDFTIAPLTSRMFRGFLERHGFEKAIFTSATIGNPGTFMGGIGFEKSSYHYLDVPSQFTPESMPVYIPKGTPKIGFKSSEADLDRQAKMIYDILKQCPTEWSGFIHTASVKQSFSIANRLSAMDSDLAKRLWVPSRESSSAKIESWRTQKMLRPNTIAVSWDFWTGLDAFDEEINIIAKIPFGTLDVLGKARMDKDKDFYAWEAACKVEQAAGRNRRGEPEHYEVEGEPTRRICVILDSNVYRVYNQFSSLFKQRINCVKGQELTIIRR